MNYFYHLSTAIATIQQSLINIKELKELNSMATSIGQALRSKEFKYATYLWSKMEDYIDDVSHLSGYVMSNHFFCVIYNFTACIGTCKVIYIFYISDMYICIESISWQKSLQIQRC